MKKLIPALCMLLVAACLMGTSTYAWFSANANVTATGMQVKAQSTGGLAIGAYTTKAGLPTAPADAAFGTSVDVDWKEGNSTIQPTSHNGTNWFTADANENTSYKANGNFVPQTEAAELLKLYQHSMWQIKSLDQAAVAADNITLKVSAIDVTGVTADGEALDLALRVAIRVGNASVSTEGVVTWTDDAWYYFAPLADGSGMVDLTDDSVTNPTYNHVESATSSVAYTSNFTAGAITSGHEVPIYTGLTADPIDVSVYVYYEGEDANCKSQYITTNVDALTVNISYTID